MEKIIYKAAVYVRISKEDGDKAESDSITNQKSLINDFLSKQPDIRIVDTFEDDGYTGVNFDRPDFERMIDEIKKGKINCVVVKDASRFGRNFTDVGNYLDRIFPFLNVRFIAINDNHDSAKIQHQSERMMMPFRNLMNDSYSRDISIKTRSQLETKRKSGQFLSPFSAYGYFKSTEDRHKLVIDDYAAEVIRDIFKWKIDGISEASIAKMLNMRGILCPVEYKKSLGLKYKTGFQTNTQVEWSYSSIRHILKNELYTGKLIQGKSTTPNHKVRKTVKADQDKWVITENAHEPIISQEDFALANKLIRSEARTAPGNKTVYPFSGIVKCGDCGHNIVRNAQKHGGKEYISFLCSTYKRGSGCTRHSFKNEWLEQTVLSSLKHFITNILTVREMLKMIGDIPLQSNELQKRTIQLEKKKAEAENLKDLITKSCKKYVEGIFGEEEFLRLKSSLNEKETAASQAIRLLEQEIEQIKNGGVNNTWIDGFLKYKDITELTRPLIVSLIEEIKIYEDKEIEIVFKHQDEYLQALTFVNNNLIKEVV